MNTRKPQHTGEHVEVEPLELFLLREHWFDGPSLARPTRRPSLTEYESGYELDEQEAA